MGVKILRFGEDLCIADHLLLGIRGIPVLLLHHRHPWQGGRLCEQLQQAMDTDTHNSRCSFLFVIHSLEHVKFPSCLTIGDMFYMWIVMCQLVMAMIPKFGLV